MSKGARKSRRSRSVMLGPWPQRTSQRWPPKKTVLIVCEGQETEPNYFRGLKKNARVSSAYRVVVKKGIGFSATAAVKKAIELKKQGDYDLTYCVVDVEGPHRRQADLRKTLALARSNNIRAILSNPSFEVWFLAHFERTCRSFKDANAVIVVLNSHWQKHWHQEYRKSDEQIYRRLADRTTTAITNAKAVREKDHGNRPVKDCNSSTEVDKLVRLLRQG